MESTVKLYSLNYSETRTYLTALIFVAGNVVLPQLFHLFPSGGTTWLPIYFFTLIGAYKYGWKAGLLTAIASPLVNSWLFGMPAPAVLPAILMKSLLLAAGAGYVAHRSKHVSVLLLLAVVAFYQLTGTGRMGFKWKSAYCTSGFPNRITWYGTSGLRRIFLYQISDI